MSFVCNLPLFMIIGSLFLAALSVLLKKAAKMITMAWLAVLMIMDVIVINYTSVHGQFTYSMGEFPAPWGNEIRAGVLEAIVLFIFLGVMLFSIIGGDKYLKLHIGESKENLYFIQEIAYLLLLLGDNQQSAFLQLLAFHVRIGSLKFHDRDAVIGSHTLPSLALDNGMHALERRKYALTE